MYRWVMQKSVPGREVGNHLPLLLKVVIVQSNQLEWASDLTSTYFPTGKLK